MPQNTLANRVTKLEQRVDHVEQLPQRVISLETQISQFREDVRVEFSAVRDEMKELHGVALTRMDELHSIAMRELRAGDEETRRQMRAGDEETRHQMRVHHEEVISRIALLDEGLNGSRRSGAAPTRKPGTKRRTPNR